MGSLRSLGVGVTLATTLSFVFACSQSKPTEDAQVGSTTAAIQGGTDDGSAHPYAVGVCIGGKGTCSGVCSGALILPNVVVTARHCVQQTSSEQIACGSTTFGSALPTNWITTSDWMFQSSAAGWHSVKSVITPPSTAVCGNDLALLILNDVIDASEAKPVVPGVQYNMGDTDRYLHELTAIGYGLTSEDDPPQSDRCFQSRAPNDPETCPGWRRMRKNIPIVCIPGDANIACPAITDANGNSALSDNEFVSEEGVCGGDSGSSAYEQASFNVGAPVSLGVLSRGGPVDGMPSVCGQSVYTRLDKWRDLIVQTAMTASASWTLYPKPSPDWTIYVPPAVDAGADADASTPVQTNLPDGAACASAAECVSGLVCEDTGSGLACTASCDPSGDNTCDNGFACAPGGFCSGNVSTTSASTPQSTIIKTGCSAAPSGSSSSPFGMAGLAAVLGIVLNTRRAARLRRGA